MNIDFRVSYIETVGILDTGIMIIVNIMFNDKAYDISYWYDDIDILITYPDSMEADDVRLLDDNRHVLIDKIKNIIPDKYDELSDIVM